LIVLAHGCFDLLHIGHVKYLESAKTLGNRLIVTITADKYISKGPGRPLFDENLRLEMIQSLKCVDHAEIVYDATAVPAILKHKPDFYVKGPDYKQIDARLELEKQAVESYGGRLIVITPDVVFSSTEIMTGEMLRLKRQQIEYDCTKSNQISNILYAVNKGVNAQ
jgi:rfaE bifunctional protein nucleotidyltransferase chain/domain